MQPNQSTHAVTMPSAFLSSSSTHFGSSGSHVTTSQLFRLFPKRSKERRKLQQSTKKKKVSEKKEEIRMRKSQRAQHVPQVCALESSNLMIHYSRYIR